MTVAASALAILTPFLKKGSERFLEEIGKSIGEAGGMAGRELGGISLDKTNQLFVKLKQKLSGNREADLTLKLWEEKPENEIYRDTFQKVLMQELTKDKVFAQDLNKLVEEIKELDPQIKVLIENSLAKKMTGFESDDMPTKGQVDVHISRSVAEEMIGARLGNQDSKKLEH